MRYSNKPKSFDLIHHLDPTKSRGFTVERGKYIFGNGKYSKRVNSKIMRDDLTPPKFFSDGEDLTYVVGKDNLPDTIVDKVEELIHTKPLSSNRCWYNSTRIHMEIDGVEKVDGWYGWKDENMTDREHSNVFGFVEDLGDGFTVMIPRVEFNDIGEVVLRSDKPSINQYEIWDTKKEIRWVRHSWNKYKGVSFDLGNELDDRDLKHEWYYYREIPKQDPPKFDTIYSKTHLQVFLDWNIGLDKVSYVNEKELNNNKIGV